MGSNLKKQAGLIGDEIKIIDLPLDLPAANDTHIIQNTPEGLHYAPLNVSGQLERVKIMTDFFFQSTSALLIVDVSVEVAMLARLCGVPAIIMRQHGRRDDLPHQIAYRNAIGLLAPYGRSMQGREEQWITEKTYYAGGLARFKQQQDTADVANRMVGIIVGSGGSSIDGKFLLHLSRSCPKWQFQLLGEIDIEGSLPNNLICHGRVKDPLALLQPCCLIIGNAGHNTVIEMASLNKRFIVIPEERPFDEQLEKAEILSGLQLAKTVLPERLMSTNWNTLLEEQLEYVPNWKHMVDTHAAENAANYIRKCFQQVFKSSERLQSF